MSTVPGYRLRPVEFAPLALGLLGLAAGTMLGWEAGFVEAVVSPPLVVRAALVTAAVVAGVALLRGGLVRIGAHRATGDPGLPSMIRGVRLVFLAVAAFAAAGGWLAGHPLPIVVALVIAGVDVIETSFLLLVARGRH